MSKELTLEQKEIIRVCCEIGADTALMLAMAKIESSFNYKCC